MNETPSSPIPDPSSIDGDSAAGVPPALAADIEAVIARYSPRSLSPAQKAAVLDDVRDAVRTARPVSVVAAAKLMQTLVRFVADTATTGGGDLAVLLTYPNINRWVADVAKTGLQRRTTSVYRGRLFEIRRALDGLEPRVGKPTRALPTTPPLPLEACAVLERRCVADGGPPLRAFVAVIAAGVPVADVVGARFEASADGMRVLTVDGVVRPVVDPAACLTAVEGMDVVDGDWLALQHLAAEHRWHLNGLTASKTFHERVLLSGAPLVELIATYRLSMGVVDGAARWLPEVDIATDRDAQRRLRGDIEARSTSAAAVARTPAGTGGPQPTSGGGSDGSSAVMTPRRSRAEARRLAEQARKQAAAPRVLTPEVEQFLERYRPAGVDDATWAVLDPAFTAAMRVCATASEVAVKRQATAVSAYLQFRYRVGLAVDDATVWTHTGIDRFCLDGMPTMTAATRNDYRSRLLTACSKINPVFAGPLVPTQGHVSVRPGYTPAEEEAIKRAALRQRNPGSRRSLSLMVGLAGGAGITGELKELRGCDVTDNGDDGIVVTVPGKRARTVVVRRSHEELVRVGIAGIGPNQLLVGRNPGRHNVGGRIVEKAELFDDTPAIDARRLRSRWLTWLITQPVPINVILAAAGLQGARSLVELAALLERPAVDDAVAARVLRDGGRS